MFRLTEFYLGVCAERSVRIPDGFRDRMPTTWPMIERALAANPVETVPCHNDLLAENYIDDGSQLWIVDFEYSGNNDPCFELGDTAQECGFDQELRAVLCEAYFGTRREDRLARMDLQARDGGRRMDPVGRDPGHDLHDRLRLLGLGGGAVGPGGGCLRLGRLRSLGPRVGGRLTHPRPRPRVMACA